MALEVGMVKTYIKDYPGFKYLVDIPAKAAMEWVKKVCPEHTLGSYIKLKDITFENLREAWNNKYWIIVGCEHDVWVALECHDGDFSIYTKKVENEDFSSET